MNIYFIIIIGIIIFEYVLSFIIRTLNIRSLNPNLPQEFSDTFDEDKYKKSQLYAKANSSFDGITSTYSLFLGLIFIFSGFYNTIDIYARSFEFNNILTGLSFFLILTLISDLLSMPFSLYRTFVIEEKFGFNKTTISTYFSDKAKQYLLMIIIGGPVLGAILYFFENTGELGWLYVWLFITFFSIIMQPIFNNFIAPMFNKFTPLEDGPLKEKITEYLNKVNFPVKKLEVVDGSKRSAHSNAYFSGFGKSKRIALFDTLVDQLDDNEILAVIAHEVGHYKLKHIHSGIILSSIQTGIMFFILSFFIMNESLFSVFYMDNLSIYASLLFFSMLYSPISMITGIVFMIISRKNEFSADAYSSKTANLPESLISGLKKMSKENLSNLTPHWLNVFLNYSHPPVIDRINALRK